MNLMAIFSGIVAIAKAIPIVKKWGQQMVDLWVDEKVENSDESHSSKDLKRSALTKAIKNAETNEDRKALSIMLADISK